VYLRNRDSIGQKRRSGRIPTQCFKKLDMVCLEVGETVRELGTVRSLGMVVADLPILGVYEC
jgi:hypothetical protein